jgi:hypothetical protein
MAVDVAGGEQGIQRHAYWLVLRRRRAGKEALELKSAGQRAGDGHQRHEGRA